MPNTIDQYLTNTPFKEFNDIPAIRENAKDFERIIDEQFAMLLDPNVLVTTPCHAKIDNQISNIKKICGDYAASFYETVYGYVLAELLNRSLEGDHGKD